MNKVHHPTYVTVGYLRGFKTVLNGGMLRNPVTEIIDFTRYMIIPLIFDWINLKVKNKALLDIYLLRLSAFILLSGIPFLIGILPPLGTVQEFQGDVLGFIGLFQTPKNASTSIAISLLIITFYFKTDSLNKQEKLFYRICILIGIIQLYLTFVRTGYVMFVVGLIVLYLPQKITFKELRPFLYVLVLVLIIFITLLQTNQAFYERIFDIRGNRTTNLGSGRLILWAASLDMWLQMNTIEKFFGIGFGGLKTSMNDYIGKSLDAHSEFFTQLVSNGIIGLTLTIIYVLNLINLLR
jgi:O-antigen ligase